MTEDMFVFCPGCDSSEAQELGQLGPLLWLRCRCCGIDFSIKIPD